MIFSGDPWSVFSRSRNQYPAPYDWNSTHYFLGSIHPRTKLYIGQRLARGVNKFVYNNDEIWQGPLIKGCELDMVKGIIYMEFRKDIMYDEQIIIQPFTLWYDKQGGNLSEITSKTSAFEIQIDGKWLKLERDALSVSDDGYGVNVNVSGFIMDNDEIMTEITGIRYAWEDYPCCGNLDITHHPCPMNLCPIITSKTRLPAIPFMADIVHNKCQCYDPQKC